MYVPTFSFVGFFVIECVPIGKQNTFGDQTEMGIIDALLDVIPPNEQVAKERKTPNTVRNRKS